MANLPKSLGDLDPLRRAARDAANVYHDLERLGLQPDGAVVRALEEQRRLEAANLTDSMSGLRKAMDVRREYERLGIEPRSAIARAIEEEKRFAAATGSAKIADRYRSPMRDALDAIGNGTLAHTLEAHRRSADMSGVLDAANKAMDVAKLHSSAPAQQTTGSPTGSDQTADVSGDAKPVDRQSLQNLQRRRAENPAIVIEHQQSAYVEIGSVADIGQRVRTARRAMGMTQQRFADLAGVGRRFLIELERGKASLEIGKVLAVCQAAGLELGIRE